MSRTGHLHLRRWRRDRLYLVSLLIFAALFLFGLWTTQAEAGEWHSQSGLVYGTTAFGSEEREPDSLAMVMGYASDPMPVWSGVRLDLELQLMRHWQGVAVGARWDLGPHWLVLASTGAGNLSANLDWQSDGFNFLLQAGVGYRWGQWRTDVRFHHISNAQLRQPNTGTNGVLFLIGRTW